MHFKDTDAELSDNGLGFHIESQSIYKMLKGCITEDNTNSYPSSPSFKSNFGDQPEVAQLTRLRFVALRPQDLPAFEASLKNGGSEQKKSSETNYKGLQPDNSSYGKLYLIAEKESHDAKKYQMTQSTFILFIPADEFPEEPHVSKTPVIQNPC